MGQAKQALRPILEHHLLLSEIKHADSNKYIIKSATCNYSLLVGKCTNKASVAH